MSETPSTNYSMLQPNSSESDQTLSTHHFNVSEPVVAKRICFYKSGDPQFNGIKMVINNRSFKTFDALLDNLSKRVPIPFGVRNISTPRGIHSITSLEDLEDGKSYICSHQRKIKPINLEQASKKPLPWQISRPVSAHRRAVQLAREKEDVIVQGDRAVKIRTPKKLLIFKNGDIRIRRTVILSKKTTQNFEVFLDYVSELMQCPVVKLYTTDGRKVPNLQSLILCSGAVVAAGREPFKPGNYDPHRYSLPAKLSGLSNRVYPKANAKSESRNVSAQIASRSQIYSVSSDKVYGNDNNSELFCIPDNYMDLAENHSQIGEDLSMARPEDDIEKSVHVNQDGSMTVEMKVRFRIKEEETIKWTTTVTRAGISADKNIKICNSALGSEDHSSDLNISAYLKPTEAPILENYSKDESNSIQQINTETKNKESESDLSTCDYKVWQNPSANMDVRNVSEDKVKPHFHRPPTPGPRRVRKKKALVESVTVISDEKVQEKTIGQFSYSKETEEGESKSEYCMVTHSSSKTSSIDNSKLSEISNNDLLKLSLENKKEETLIKLNHKSLGLKATTNKKTLEMSDEDGQLQNILEKSIVEEGMCNSLLSSCKANISDFVASSMISQTARPVSADTVHSLHDRCGIKEIKRSLSSFIRYSEFSQSKSEERLCDPCDLLVSSQGLLSSHSSCTGSNQTKMTVPTCTNVTPETLNLTTRFSPTSAESEKQFSGSTERDTTTHFTDENHPASAHSKKKKKKRKSLSHYLEQGVDSHQNQQYRETVEEDTFKTEEMSCEMCMTSKSMQESTEEIRERFAETCQKRVVAFPVRSSDGSISSSLCPANECYPQVPVKLQANELLCSKKTKANRQLTNIKSRSTKKISLPLSAKYEDGLIVGKADSKSEIDQSQNTQGTEKDGMCHHINSIKWTQNSLVASKPLSEVPNGSSIEREKEHVISDSSYKSSEKGKKQKKMNLSTSENKINMSDGANTLDALNQEDFPEEIAEYSLENYVQNWLQNTFANTALHPNKLAPIYKKDGSVANSKICHSPVENTTTLSNKETRLIANEGHIIGKTNLIEHPLVKMPVDPVSEMGDIEESGKWLRGRQIGSLTNADAGILKEATYFLQSDLQRDTKLQVLNEIHINDKNFLQSEVDTQDVSPSQSKSVEVAVQIDSNVFNQAEMVIEKDCMSTVLLQQLQSTLVSMQKANIGCIEKSCGLRDFSSLSSSSPNLLLAWLLVLNLKESLNGICKGDMLKTTCSCSEIFSLLQFLKQTAVTEEADDLKDVVSDLQESTSKNLLHFGRIGKQDSACCHENPSVVEIENVPNLHENENPARICIPKDNIKSEKNVDVQKLMEEFESSDEQRDPSASVETSDLNDLSAHKTLSDRTYPNINSNNYLTSNVELSEGHEELDSSLQESQDKTTDTSFNNEESETSEEPNSIVTSITSNDKDNILDLEISEAEDIMPLANNKNAVKQDVIGEPSEQHKLVAETSTECGNEEDSMQEEKKENGTCEETTERLLTPSPLSFCYESKQATDLDTTGVEQKSQVKLIVKELECGTHSNPSFEFKKCFNSPATSDWSDYRPDTDDSDYNFRASSDFTNESGEEAMNEKLYNTGYVKRTIEQLYGKAEVSFKPAFHIGTPYMSKVVQKDAEESHCAITKKTASLSQEHNSRFVEQTSSSSLVSHECLAEINEDSSWRRENFSLSGPQHSLNEEKAYYNNNCSVRCTKQYCQSSVHANKDEGILIDKGKWLLKENHLMRRSPPEKTGMYGNLDTTSGDTTFDNNSDDVPYSHFGNLNLYPPCNELSSSEPEDRAKPPDNGCNYFIMPHNTDSEPFSEDLTMKNKPNLSGDTPSLQAVKKENNNSSFTLHTTSTNLCTEANANYPAFTSVEFKLPNNKVHPVEEPLNDESVRAQPTNDHTANRAALEEQDSLDKLHAICGQHCPILMAIIKPVNEEGRGYAYQKASDIENQLGRHLLTEKGQHLLWTDKDLKRHESSNVTLKNNCINKIANNIFNGFYANNTLDFINKNSFEILVSSALGGKNNLKMLYAMEDKNVNAKEITSHENNASKQVLSDIAVSTNNKLPDTRQKICQSSRVSLIQILEEKSAPLLTDLEEGCHSETFHKCDIILNSTEYNASENLEDENTFSTEKDTLFCEMCNESKNEEKGT